MSNYSEKTEGALKEILEGLKKRREGSPLRGGILLSAARLKRLRRYRRRSRRWWLKRFYFRSQRVKEGVRVLYRRNLWEDYERFQLGVESGSRGYGSADVLSIEAAYRESEGKDLVKESGPAVKSVMKKGGVKKDKGEGKVSRRGALKAPKVRKSRGATGVDLFFAHYKGVTGKRHNRYRRLKRRWSLRKGLDGGCYITQTRNNIFVVVMCEKSGRVIMELSAGKLGYKGAAKRTRLVSVQLGRRVGSVSKSKNYRKMTIYLRGRISMLVRGVVQGLQIEGISVRRLVYVREIAHNGVRARKSRRM